MTGKHPYVVGEQGPEIMVPGGPGRREASESGRLFVPLQADGSELFASLEFLCAFFEKRPDAARRALNLVGESAETFVPDFDVTSAIVAGEVWVSLKPGERLRRLVAACRAGDGEPGLGEET